VAAVEAAAAEAAVAAEVAAAAVTGPHLYCKSRLKIKEEQLSNTAAVLFIWMHGKNYIM